MTKNQIDFITINRRFRNSVTQLSERVPRCRSKLRSCHISMLHSNKVKEVSTWKAGSNSLLLAHQFREAVETELKEKEQTDNIDQCFDSFQRALTSATEKLIPHVVPCMKQEWMTIDILNLMEVRRKAKGDNERYRELDRNIRNKCQTAKTEFYDKQCEELERLEKTNPQLMHSNA